MKTKTIISLLLLLLPLASYAEPVASQRTTILIKSQDKVVAEFIFPLGSQGNFSFKARHIDMNNDDTMLHATGNAQIRISLPNLKPISLVGDEIIVKKETLDEETIKVISDLEKMGETDQALRGAPTGAKLSDSEWADQIKTDQKNMERLAEIVDKYGWPGATLFGLAAAQSAFLVLQHGDKEHQEKYLPLFREAVLNNEAASSDLALLEDRVRVRNGRPQIYGSQLNGAARPELFPIEDEVNVDKRRESVGLEPLAEYLRRFGIEYHLR